MDLHALLEVQLKTDQTLAAMLARQETLELAVATLIQSHPQPQHALAIWQHAQLELADRAFAVESLPTFRDQMAACLARWTDAFASATPEA
ncbi:hypothetical protein [Pseudoxanthomonas sp. X-1]|uniref:hypothetical protein n=1 Tax=Pseudoxanthomonas sp. X-1 TaxID=2571115 RepID=UPI00110B955C|nr:hypothetical protein [Pseudoxanthomonas sp. X-1]TMN18487.1 hypothetical protein FF950_14500 [Pseudoxanthomonas sp. X-1]UAY76009.1 hypothetical protein LAJ50_07165 [Pseudoxanthomonas sp. X-1]